MASRFKNPLVIALLSATPTAVRSFASSSLPLLHQHAATKTSPIHPHYSKSRRDGLHPIRNSASVVPHATSITASSWKPCCQPNFNDFAECTVGPWKLLPVADATAPIQEVEEVMRSCGGAVQGIRELPLSLLFQEEDCPEGERTYHNRADGGFVYADDGSYSAGPEQWDWNTAANNDSGGLVMASLAFPNRRGRMWITVQQSQASEIVCSCHTAEGGNGLHRMKKINALELSRPFIGDMGNEYSSNVSELASSQLPNVNWKEIQRVRMPSSSQAWSLARAKWERQIIETDPVVDDDDGDNAANETHQENLGPLVGQAYIETISQDEVNVLFGDTVTTDSINLHMLAVCPVSKTARSVLRCYDTNGSLKSVAFLCGSLS